MTRFYLIIASTCALLGGCANGPPPEFYAGVAAENAALVRCPRNDTETAVLFNIRLAFDVLTSTSIKPEWRTLIDAMRATTNAHCNL